MSRTVLLLTMTALLGGCSKSTPAAPEAPKDDPRPPYEGSSCDLRKAFQMCHEYPAAAMAKPDFHGFGEKSCKSRTGSFAQGGGCPAGALGVCRHDDQTTYYYDEKSAAEGETNCNDKFEKLK